MQHPDKNVKCVEDCGCRNAGAHGSSATMVRALTSEFVVWTGRCCLYPLGVDTKPGSDLIAALLGPWIGA